MAEARTFRTDDGLPTLGMRTSKDWTAEEAPDSYREGILWLYPNGPSPLTAILTKLKNTKEENSHYHWFTQTLPIKSAAITACYLGNDSGGTNFTDSNSNVDIADSVAVAIKMPNEDLANMVKVGHEIILNAYTQSATGATCDAADLVIRVTGIVKNGANTYIKGMTIRQATMDTSVLQTAEGRYLYGRVQIAGNINPEGSTRPAAVSYNAQEFGNYQQIFRTAMAINRNANIKNRLGEPYQNLKKSTLQDHSIELEWAFLKGEKGWRMGDNGQPERTTQGIIPFVRANAPSNILNLPMVTGNSWSTSAWAGASGYGLDALEYIIRTAFAWGTSTEKPALIGTMALAAIQSAVRNGGNTLYSLTPGVTSYGIKVVTLESVFGTLHLVRHPLWTPAQEPTMARSMLVLSPENLEFRYALDTVFHKDDRFGKGGGDGLDGLVEDFQTEAGLALYHPQTFTYAYNLGLTHVAS